MHPMLLTPQLTLEITIVSSGSVRSSVKPSLLALTAFPVIIPLEMMFSFSEFLIQLGNPSPLDGTYAVLSQFLQSV